MKSPQLAVVIPVYNAKKEYLDECFESIECQTFKDYEVIIVDDGSKAEIANYLDKRRLPNWRVIHQQNSGVATARNNGFKQAGGAKYVFFLDQDDIFLPDFFEKMVDKAESNNSDITMCWFDYYNDKVKEAIPNKNPADDIIDKIDDVNNFNYSKCPDSIYQLTNTTAWNKLFSAQFLRSNKLAFDPKHLGGSDDGVFTLKALVLARKISLTPDKLMLWRMNTGASGSDKRTHPMASFDAYVQLKRFLDKNKLYQSIKNSFINKMLSGDPFYFLRDSDTEFADNYDKMRNWFLGLDEGMGERVGEEIVMRVIHNATVQEYYLSKIMEKDRLISDLRTELGHRGNPGVRNAFRTLSESIHLRIKNKLRRV